MDHSYDSKFLPLIDKTKNFILFIKNDCEFEKSRSGILSKDRNYINERYDEIIYNRNLDYSEMKRLDKLLNSKCKFVNNESYKYKLSKKEFAFIRYCIEADLCKRDIKMTDACINNGMYDLIDEICNLIENYFNLDYEENSIYTFYLLFNFLNKFSFMIDE